jgi:hypothetical protein
MRLFALLFVLMTFPLLSLGQKIDYSVPREFKKDISKDDFKTIVDLSIPAISKRYAIDFVKEGVVQLKAGQDMQLFNLHNLIGKCLEVPDRSRWSEVVSLHFYNIFTSLEVQKKINLRDFESVKEYLGIRIYPKTSIDQRGGPAGFVVKTDLEDTYTLLMLDLPSTFSPVPKEAFESWGKSQAEVFRLAQQHINAQPIEKITKTFDVDGTKLELTFLGNEDYAGSYALDLIHNSPDLVGEWGSAIAIPNKGVANICKISPEKPLDFMQFIQITKPLIEKAYSEHPQQISDQYFWYYQGTFTQIQVQTDAEGKLSVLSPAGLTALMVDKK